MTFVAPSHTMPDGWFQSEDVPTLSTVPAIPPVPTSVVAVHTPGAGADVGVSVDDGVAGGVVVAVEEGELPTLREGDGVAAAHVITRTPLKLELACPSVMKMEPSTGDTAMPRGWLMSADAVAPLLYPTNPVPTTVVTSHVPISMRRTRAHPGSVHTRLPFASCAMRKGVFTVAEGPAPSMYGFVAPDPASVVTQPAGQLRARMRLLE